MLVKTFRLRKLSISSLIGASANSGSDGASSTTSTAADGSYNASMRFAKIPSGARSSSGRRRAVSTPRAASAHIGRLCGLECARSLFSKRIFLAYSIFEIPLKETLLPGVADSRIFCVPRYVCSLHSFKFPYSYKQDGASDCVVKRAVPLGAAFRTKFFRRFRNNQCSNNYSHRNSNNRKH